MNDPAPHFPIMFCSYTDFVLDAEERFHRPSSRTYQIESFPVFQMFGVSGCRTFENSIKQSLQTVEELSFEWTQKRSQYSKVVLIQPG